MHRRVSSRLLLLALSVCAALWSASCAVPTGPGYLIEKQEITVRFEPATPPVVHIDAEYQLHNVGTRSLPSLEIRFPGRRFHMTNLAVTWDGAAVTPAPSPSSPRNSVLEFQQPWARLATHALRLSFDIGQPASEEQRSAFTSAAFFLPQAGWSPELAPARGFLGFGGVPPDRWNLAVAVPPDFRVHAGGSQAKPSRRRGRTTLVFEQTDEDLYPFVVAGRYSESPLNYGRRTIYLWTTSPLSQSGLANAASVLDRELRAYDTVFGSRGEQPSTLWIVECSPAQRCIAGRNAAFARFFGPQAGAANAELVSRDTVLVDLSGETSRVATIAAPSLAASWLGYGRNPGFYDQDPPLSALPLFAAAVGREAVEGPEARSDMIRRALADIPESLDRKQSEAPAIIRAKSFLFFYALRDRYGAEVFDRAIQHMLDARQGRGFNLSDLIASFEQETHQNVAEFVRLWIKHPGVPAEFRARYAEASAAAIPTPEETEP